MEQFYSKSTFFHKTLLLFLFLIGFQGYTQIFSDPLTGTPISSGNTYFKSATGTTTNSNITVDGIKINPAANGMNMNNGYFGYKWTDNNINLTKYFEISLTPNSCYRINFNTLDISFKINDQSSSNIGPTRVAIRCSSDNYASDLYSYSITSVDHAWVANVDITSLINISGNIKFRIYAWGGNNNNSNNNFGINDYSFSNGSVNSNITTPIVSTTVATCGASGTATITNYSAANTYTFTPAGPTVGAGGTINSMVTGTSYTVRASNSGCNSANSSSFSIAAKLTTPTTPTVSTTSTTCSTSGTATITNYSAASTYAFSPSGPTVSTGGVINGMITGTSYIVTANNGSCISVASTSFSITDNSSTTWNGSSWSNGVPDLTKNAIINSDYDMVNNAGLANITACSLTINSPAKVIVKSNSTFTLQNALTITAGANLDIKNSGSLVQINNNPSPANSGDIKMERIAFIDFRDYVYWSSPVANFNSADISTYSNNANLYKWIPTVAGNGIGSFGNWTNGTETMVLGKGYIERGLNNAPLNSPVNFTSTFTGVPNNGTITTPISRGNYSGANYNNPTISPTAATQDDDNWNLLGNPYPSAIDARAFLTANSANLDGFVKIWTHGIAPNTSAPDPFYNNYGYNYDPTDYITYNLSGSSTQSGFDGYIGAGQGFMTKMLHGSTSASTNAVFNNSMRSSSYRNDQFYKNSDSKSTNYDEGRIWIDLVSSTASNSTLVAYVNGATDNKDQMYDAQADLKATFSIYSLLEGYDRNIIQGRSLPFNQNDMVPLAIKLPTAGSYTIAIQGVDGLFNNTNQNIYLEDKQLNTIHDLRSAPYSFTAAQGETTNRFVLRYTNQTLNNNNFNYNNTVSVYASETINVKSSLENIKDIKVYDILGKVLLSKNKVGKNEIVINELKPTSSLLIVKTILENGIEITKKIIY